MKKTLQRVLAVVLSLVMVAGLVAIDSSAALAAKKLKKVSTGKKTVYSGQSRTFKISGTNAKKAKWTVSGTGKKYVKITGKKTGKTFKFKVKENATGKAKITAKLTKKNKVSYTYNLKCKATGMSLSNQDIYTNDVVTLTPTFTPSNAVKPAGDATYEVFSDADCTTAATTVVVTPSGISAEFAATAPGTYYVRATVEGLDSAVAAITVTDKVAKITNVTQTKMNELVMTVDAVDPKLTPENLIIQDAVTEQRFYVKSITPDKADATKLTVVTLTNITTGKDVVAKYAGSEYTFTATTGEVSEISLNHDIVPIKTDIPIKAITKDVNGVQIDEEPYGTSNEKFLTFNIEFRDSKGTTDSSEGTMKFDEVGEVADVTIKYNTGKVDANGEAQTIDFTGTIRSKDQAVVTGIEAVRFYARTGSDDGGIEDYTKTENNTYEKLMKNRSKYMSDKVRAGKKYRLAVLVKDAEGYTRINGSLTEAGYTLSSADGTILLVEDDLIAGSNEGDTQILARNEKGEVEFTIPVHVDAAPRLKSVKLSKSTIELTTGNMALPSKRLSGADPTKFEPDSGNITVTGIDQYGDDYDSITVKCEDSSDKNYKSIVGIEEGSTITATVSGRDSGAMAVDRAITTDSAINEECIGLGKFKENMYTITVTDNNDDTTKITKSMTVKVRQPDAARKLALKLSSTDVDTTVKDGSAELTNQVVDVRLAVTDSSGVHIGYVPLPSMASISIKRGTTEYVKEETSKAAVTLTSAGYKGAEGKASTVTKAGLTVYGGHVTSIDAITALPGKVGPFKVGVSGTSINSGDVNTLAHEDTFNDNIQFVTRGLATTCVDEKIKGVDPLLDGGNWRIASKVDKGSYRVTVKGVEFKNGAFDYDAGNTKTVYANFTVKDSQGGVVVTQDYKTTKETITNTDAAAATVALRTLRFEPEGAEPYIWDGEKDATGGIYKVGFRVVGNNTGYVVTNAARITLNRIVVFVPYRHAILEDKEYSATFTDGGVYLPMVVNTKCYVDAE